MRLLFWLPVNDMSLDIVNGFGLRDVSVLILSRHGGRLVVVGKE